MAIKTSQGREAAYTRYKNARQWEKNRRLKLERALKRNPENAEQINLALKNIVYRRSTPLNKEWSSTRKQTAQLFKKFCGKFDSGYWNEKTHYDSVFKNMRLPEQVVASIAKTKTNSRISMFSIQARLQLPSLAGDK